MSAGVSGPPDYRCPVCRAPAHLLIGPSQALCSGEECNVLIFDPSQPDGGMANYQEVQLPDGFA